MNIDSLVLKNSRYLFIFSAVCVILAVFFAKTASSQTLPVGISDSIEDSVRRSQLLDNDSNRFSYMIRPIGFPSESDRSTIKILPLLWRQQFTSHHPYGINDGSMILSKGYQTMISGGVYAKYGPLSLQLRPEFVYASNGNYSELYESSNGSTFVNTYISRQYNRIDMPSRFGEKSYSRADLGQSSLRLTFDPISIALSNENLWWGPGIRSSLLMSNNSAGFKHLTFNTSKSVNIGIGSLEGQIVAGKLEASGFKVPDPRFGAKPDDWRYLSGITMVYQPKWVRNLYLGFDRTFMIYSKDLDGIASYLPLFSSLSKANFNNEEGTINIEDERRRDQYFSLFARWIFPESKAEVYFQFGRNDFAWDLRDAFVEADHSRAYIAGFQKLIPIGRPDEFIQVAVEVLQTAQTATGGLRGIETWYTHYQVLDGYTNKGQVLGAGAGPGSNMQTVNINWVKGLKRVGFMFEHIEREKDLYYYTSESGVTKEWKDLALSGNFDLTYRKFNLNAQMTYVKSLNYQYESGDDRAANADNLQLRLGLLYNF